MQRIAERQHVNGWTAFVDAAADCDQLMGYAISPSGERHDAPGNRFSYAGRLDVVQKSADLAIAFVAPHNCIICPPWTARAPTPIETL